jgi:hypothetical protein
MISCSNAPNIAITGSHTLIGLWGHPYYFAIFSGRFKIITPPQPLFLKPAALKLQQLFIITSGYFFNQ